MISIIDSSAGEINNHGKKKKKVLRDFQKEEDVKLTKIKLKTLNPEWKQYFKLCVLNSNMLLLSLKEIFF